MSYSYWTGPSEAYGPYGRPPSPFFDRAPEILETIGRLKRLPPQDEDRDFYASEMDFMETEEEALERLENGPAFDPIDTPELEEYRAKAANPPVEIKPPVYTLKESEEEALTRIRNGPAFDPIDTPELQGYAANPVNPPTGTISPARVPISSDLALTSTISLRPLTPPTSVDSVMADPPSSVCASTSPNITRMGGVNIQPSTPPTITDSMGVIPPPPTHPPGLAPMGVVDAHLASPPTSADLIMTRTPSPILKPSNPRSASLRRDKRKVSSRGASASIRTRKSHTTGIAKLSGSKRLLKPRGPNTNYRNNIDYRGKFPRRAANMVDLSRALEL
ncbi:hypothetical protein ABW19_dt0206344 [Dactylella cylindrospora]|nr:hypothetical protein ABW19_dt0206344 [Dactylella cylindrospora]